MVLFMHFLVLLVAIYMKKPQNLQSGKMTLKNVSLRHLVQN